MNKDKKNGTVNNNKSDVSKKRRNSFGGSMGNAIIPTRDDELIRQKMKLAREKRKEKKYNPYLLHDLAWYVFWGFSVIVSVLICVGLSVLFKEKIYFAGITWWVILLFFGVLLISCSICSCLRRCCQDFLWKFYDDIAERYSNK